MPGDVGRMIDVLEHYRKTAFDILTHLPVELGTEILSYLDVPELLSKSSVRLYPLATSPLRERV